MDDIWSKTVQRLEAELEEYRQLKEMSAPDDDPALIEDISRALQDAKAALDRKYSQLIAFAAGLSDDLVDFDADLNAGAIVVSRRGNVSYIFGPESVSSSDPYFSPELAQFIADQIASKGAAASATAVGSDRRNHAITADGPEDFAASIAASHSLGSMQPIIQAGGADRLSDRVEESYSGISCAASSAALAFMSRSLGFARQVETSHDMCTSTALPQVDFEYLS